MEKLRKKLAGSAAARWSVLVFVSFTLVTGYMMSDLLSPLKPLLESELGWSSSEFGVFMSGYGIFNVFLLMLIFGGMILDRFGERFTGLLAIVLMFGGSLLKYWALSTPVDGSLIEPALFGLKLFSLKTQVFYATLGYAVFGVGIELLGITATKIIVKWFRGGSVALALGLNLAGGRLGTLLAMAVSYPLTKWLGSAAAIVAVATFLLLVGLVIFIVFCVMDRRLDRELAADAETGTTKAAASGLTESELSEAEDAEEAPEEDEKFRFTDIFRIASLRGFWLITLLCLLFYSAVFPFLKFATDFMVQKFGIDPSWAGILPALIPLGNIILTPLFGSLYDRKGKGATLMVIGAVMLLGVHLLFAVPILDRVWMAVVLMLILGGAFSLVPSAMWPSVPKIIPYHQLGTAYSLIFWIQNWGLMGVPLLMGWLLDKYCVIGEIVIDGNLSTHYNYTLPMLIFAVFGLASVVLALFLRKEDARKGYGLELPNIATEEK